MKLEGGDKKVSSQYNAFLLYTLKVYTIYNNNIIFG